METTTPVSPVTKVTDYEVHFNGLFGRNRKPKFTTVRVARVPEGKTPETPNEALATEGLNKLAAKRGNWKLVARPVELKNHGGVTMESFMLFSDVTLATGAV